MTDKKDKTRDKLLNSMRLNKEGETAPAESPKQVAASTSKAAKKASKPAKKTPKTKPTGAKAANSPKQGADPYQGVARIWPD